MAICARGLAPLALVALLAASGLAAAHENRALADGVHRIPAGGALELREELHYHRLVGEVRALDAPGAALRVIVVGPEGERSLAGPGTDLRVNALVRCCDAASWTPHAFRIENAGARSVDVHARLVLLHDGLAVAAEDAEAGAAISMWAVALAPVIVIAARLRRGPASGPARPRLAAGGTALAAVWLLAGALALASILRYGGGPAAGVVASAAYLPWVGNAFLTTADLLTLALLALWIAALAWWGAAARREPRARAVTALAGALALSPLVAGAAWAVEYRAWLVPGIAALVAAGLPLAWLAPPARRALLGRRSKEQRR